MFIPIRDYIPARRRPWVTYGLIVTNVLVWLWQYALELSGVGWVIPAYGMVPSRLTLDPGGEAFTLLTSIFMHGGWLHLAGNMLFLHVFGDNVEDALGPVRYVGFYLVCGVIASTGHYLVDPMSQGPLVGASGAIFGVLGAYMVLYPRAPVMVINPYLPLWFFIGPLPSLPAWFVAGGYFVVHLVQGYTSLSRGVEGGIAYFAHVAGFAAGLLLVRWWARSHVEPDQTWRPPPSGPPRVSEWRSLRRR